MVCPSSRACGCFGTRQDFFEMAGLDPNRPPTSWDELIEYAKAPYGNGRERGRATGIDLERWTGSNMMSNLQEFFMYFQRKTAAGSSIPRRRG